MLVEDVQPWDRDSFDGGIRRPKETIAGRAELLVVRCA